MVVRFWLLLGVMFLVSCTSTTQGPTAPTEPVAPVPEMPPAEAPPSNPAEPIPDGIHTVTDPATGDVYTGEYKNGKKNGQGTISYARDQKIYTGTFVNDIKEGQGKQTWPAGHKFLSYEGEWKAGLPNGQGILLYDGGMSYTGSMKDGKLDGVGRMIEANGDVRDGKWLNGLREGSFSLVTKAGKKYSETFEHDKRTSIVSLDAKPKAILPLNPNPPRQVVGTAPEELQNVGFSVAEFDQSSELFRSGVRTGDRIVKVDGRKILAREGDLTLERILNPVGADVRVDAVRDGKLLVFYVKGTSAAQQRAP